MLRIKLENDKRLERVGKCIDFRQYSNFFINSPGSNNQGRLLTPEEGCGFQPQDKAFLMQYHRMFQLIISNVLPNYFI